MRPFVLLVLALPGMAMAAPQSRRDTVAALDDLGSCRAIGADAERLACYDRIAGRIASARQSGELMAFDRKAVTEDRRTRFGLVDAPAEVAAGAGTQAAARAADVREITSTITGVLQGPGFGKWNLQLANGQLWQTVEGDRYGPRAGAGIRIVTTVTGGFRASIDRGHLTQVKRVR